MEVEEQSNLENKCQIHIDKIIHLRRVYFFILMQMVTIFNLGLYRGDLLCITLFPHSPRLFTQSALTSDDLRPQLPGDLDCGRFFQKISKFLPF